MESIDYLIDLGKNIDDLLLSIQSLNYVSSLVIREGKRLFFYSYLTEKPLSKLAGFIADKLNSKFRGNDFKYGQGETFKDGTSVFEITGLNHKLSFKIVPDLRKSIPVKDLHETIYFTCVIKKPSSSESDVCNCCCS